MMKRNRLNIALVLVVMAVFFIVPHQVSAVKKVKGLVIGESIKIHSRVLNEDRALLVYLPDGYASSREKYPILFLLDGDYHFHHVTGIIDFLTKSSRIPRMIVIAIPNKDRNRDLLPTRVDNFPPVAGADKFLAFLREEVIPLVDNNYRTAPYRILCGHSYGGLFSINSLLNSPELFHAYIVISPSVYWDDRLMFKKAENFFQNYPGLKRFVYLTTAGGDRDAIRFASKDFAGLLKKKAPSGLEWQFQFMEKEDHSSTVHRVVYNALEALYPGWKLSRKQLSDMSLQDIRKHYKKLSKKYGYEIPVPERTIDFKAFLLFREKKTGEAIKMLKYNVASYPGSAKAYFNLGLAYDAAGKLALAKENFEMAVKIGEKNKHDELSVFKEELSRLLEKIKPGKTEKKEKD
jgi:predicted alpha/beta superfamily hydrolase